METFFRKGEPNNSVRTMLMNDRKPSPMNSGEPHLSTRSCQLKPNRRKSKYTHGSGLGAEISGQSSKKPLEGLLMQSFEPPPQFAIPELPMRDAPIIRITVPVTIGGNTRCNIRTGTKDMNISRNEQIRDVPSTYPYASGHGSLVTVPSAAVVLVHVPLAYMALKIFCESELACKGG